MNFEIMALSCFFQTYKNEFHFLHNSFDMMDLEECRIYKDTHTMDGSGDCSERTHQTLRVELCSNASSCSVAAHICTHTSSPAALTLWDVREVRRPALDLILSLVFYEPFQFMKHRRGIDLTCLPIQNYTCVL